MYVFMSSGTRMTYPHRLNKEFSMKFPIGYMDQYTPNEGQMAQQLKHWDDNNKDEDMRTHVNNDNS